MKRRLRKKRHRKEFAEFGWYVNYALHSDMDDAYAGFWDPLVTYVESLNLLMGGSISSFFIHPETRLPKIETENRRRQLQQWLTAHPDVKSSACSPLTDVWYGPFQK